MGRGSHNVPVLKATMKKTKSEPKAVGSAVAAGSTAGGPVRTEDSRASELHRVHFEYFNPTARDVRVAGSFNDWNVRSMPMKAHEGGRWSIEFQLKPGHYEYRFVVDDHWINDPTAETFVTNPYNGLNCVVEVIASTPHAPVAGAS